MTKKEFLDENIFQGLENLNTGFDARDVKYFSESDFEIVLSRVEKLGLGIYGIEPWLNENMFDVYSAEEYSKKPTNPKWYKSAFKKFKRLNKDLLYAASYEVPEKNHLIFESKVYTAKKTAPVIRRAWCVAYYVF